MPPEALTDESQCKTAEGPDRLTNNLFISVSTSKHFGGYQDLIALREINGWSDGWSVDITALVEMSTLR